MSHQARDLAANRAHAPHTSMFLRMLLRAAVLRRGRAASALFAMVVAAAVATAMLNLYVDVQAKLQREFRNYGANIILVGKNGAPLPAKSLGHVDAVLASRGIAAPFGMIVARASDGQPIVVAGTDFDRVKQLNRWWSVSKWPATTTSRKILALPWSVYGLSRWSPLRASPSISRFKEKRFASRRQGLCRPEQLKTAGFTFRFPTSLRGQQCSHLRLKSPPAGRQKK